MTTGIWAITFRGVRIAGLLVALAAGPARGAWFYATTEHFELVSGASEAASRRLLADLEEFRASFLAVFPMPRAREPRALVVLFEKDADFVPYKPRFNGKPILLSGLLAPSPDRPVIAMSVEYSAADTREMIFHEYVHSLVFSRGWTPPPWFNEGLAELYSTFKIQGGEVEFGGPKPRHVELLAREPLMPLGKLFAITQGSAEYNEGTRRGVFYAQSWALMHYWLFGTDVRNRERALNFVRRTEREKEPPERAFREVFGTDYAATEAALRDYLKTGRYYVKRARLALGDVAGRVELRPATEFERELALAELGWCTQRTGERAYRVQRLADREPAAPRPREILAIAGLRDQLVPEALEQWERAEARGSTNAFVYVELAKGTFGPLVQAMTLDYRLPGETVAMLRRRLGRALELSPDYTEAYELLAMVEALAERPNASALRRVQQAEPLMRDPFYPTLALAIAGWRANELIPARDRCERLLAKPGAPARVTALARELLGRIAAGAAKR